MTSALRTLCAAVGKKAPLGFTIMMEQRYSISGRDSISASDLIGDVVSIKPPYIGKSKVTVFDNVANTVPTDAEIPSMT
jgi:hypothetical protein